MNIRTRLIAFYSVLFLISIFLSIILYQQIYRNNLTEQAQISNEQMLESITNQVSEKLITINNYSRIILSDSNVQDLLRNGNSPDRIRYLRKAGRFLDELMNNFDEIHTVYLMDMEGNSFYNDRLTDLNDNPRELINTTYSARWKQSTEALKGGVIIVANGDDFYYSLQKDGVVSCMRVVNDLDTQLPIGVLVVNVDANIFSELNLETLSHDGALMIQDLHGQTIGESLDLRQFDQQRDYFTSQKTIGRFGWTITLVTKVAALSKGYRQLMVVGIVIVLMNGLILFIGSAWMASRLSSPISDLTKAIKKYEVSKDNHVFLDTEYPEFKELQHGFNRMTQDIKALFEALKHEQRTKRKAELKVLQAQIKPHFLYNTFDSVCALALMEDHDAVYKVMSSLGQFYKLSLSKGKELITLREEIQILKHYLAIQSYRYPDLFSVTYKIDESVLSQPMLKLMLQPLVENALYHGLKPKVGSGNILIEVAVEDEWIKIRVQDDGIGMTQQVLHKVLYGKEKGFGLAGTIERLKLYTGDDQVVKVESQEGVGTSLRIRVKKEIRR